MPLAFTQEDFLVSRKDRLGIQNLDSGKMLSGELTLLYCDTYQERNVLVKGKLKQQKVLVFARKSSSVHLVL